MSKELVKQDEHAISVPVVEEKTIIDYMDAFGHSQKLLPNEKKAFINIAKEFGLNPFKREIYCVAYGEGKYRNLSIVTGYEVYLKRAERIGRLDGWNVTTKGDGQNLVAIVTIHRKDWTHPFTHEVYYKEVVNKKSDGTVNQFWSKSPVFMTKKVAMAQAFRLCFPDEFGGMPYTNDELGLEKQEERNVTEVHTDSEPTTQKDVHSEPITEQVKETVQEPVIVGKPVISGINETLVTWIDSGICDKQSVLDFTELLIEKKQNDNSKEFVLKFYKNLEEGNEDVSFLVDGILSTSLFPTTQKQDYVKKLAPYKLPDADKDKFYNALGTFVNKVKGEA